MINIKGVFRNTVATSYFDNESIFDLGQISCLFRNLLSILKLLLSFDACAFYEIEA